MTYSTLNKQHPAATLGVSIFAAITLSACGGGGGSSESPDKTPKTPSLTEKPLSLSAGENQTITRELDGTVDTASINAIIDNPAVEIEANGKTLSIIVGELENDGNARFTIQTSADSKYTVNVAATNTSAEPLIERANMLTDAAAPNLMLADELRLQKILAELEYLAQERTESDKRASISEAQTVAEATTATAAPQIESLELAVNNYDKGQITETDLEQALQSAQGIVQAYGEAGEQILADHAATLADLGLTFPANLNDTYPLEYVAELDRYTRFTHEDFGQLQGESFTFNASYDFLNTVFTYAK